MWELRVESAKSNVLEKMGLAISYMTINHFGLSAYIHPLMQDPTLPEEQALLIEGTHNQKNGLWCGYSRPQNHNFFFNPPRDENNNLIDTRTSRIISEKEKNKILSLKENKKYFFNDPNTVINSCFHIHLDYQQKNKTLALMVFDKFLEYLSVEKLQPTSTRLYEPRENGPHIQGGWEVKFETKNELILEKIGVAVGWLMCNRQDLAVFMHPVTWQGKDHSEELKSHKEYAFFLGTLPELDLTFFTKNIS